MKVGSLPSIGTVWERFLLKIPSSDATCDLFVPLKKYPTALNNISLVLMYISVGDSNGTSILQILPQLQKNC